MRFIKCFGTRDFKKEDAVYVSLDRLKKFEVYGHVTHLYFSTPVSSHESKTFGGYSTTLFYLPYNVFEDPNLLKSNIVEL